MTCPEHNGPTGSVLSFKYIFIFCFKIILLTFCSWAKGIVLGHILWRFMVMGLCPVHSQCHMCSDSIPWEVTKQENMHYRKVSRVQAQFCSWSTVTAPAVPPSPCILCGNVLMLPLHLFVHHFNFHIHLLK